MPDPDLGHVANEDRSAVGLFQDDGLDIAQRSDQAESADDRTLRVALQDVAARIGIILRHRIVDLMQRQIVFPESCRIDDHLILLHKPAQGVDIDHARHALEQGAQHPILEGPLIRQLLFDELRIGCRRVRPLQIILVDLAQAGADRRHHRFQPLRQSFLCRDHPLQHQLAGEVDIHVVVEDNGEL